MNLDINVVCSSHFVVNVDQGHFSTSQPYPRGRVPLWRWWKWRRGRIGADIWPLPKTIIHSWPSTQERPQISLRGLLITAASFYFHLIYWYLYNVYDAISETELELLFKLWCLYQSLFVGCCWLFCSLLYTIEFCLQTFLS